MKKSVITTFRLDCYQERGEKETYFFTSLDAANKYVGECMDNQSYARMDVVKEILSSRLIFRINKIP